MKKLLSVALVFTMLFALAIPAMAANDLYKSADGWYYNAEEAGTLTVKDNKVAYTYDVVAGENFLGLQRGYTGQLKFVAFEAAHVCDFVKNLVGAEAALVITKDKGNTNTYSFVITEEFEWVCECGERLENTFEDSSFVIPLANNYKGNVVVGNYTVYVASSGNTTVNALYIVE